MSARKRCAVCGNLFQPKRNRVQTCSKRCADALRTGRPKLSPELDRDLVLIRVADGLRFAWGWSEMQAFDYLVALLEAGVTHRSKDASGVRVGFKLPHTTFPGRRSTLEKKARQLSRGERRNNAHGVTRMLKKLDRQRALGARRIMHLLQHKWRQFIPRP